MSLQLRPASSSDYDYAKGIHHTAYKEMVLEQFGKWEEPVQDRYFEKSWNSAPYDIIMFEGKPCGYCCIEENDAALQLKEFAVDISKQGKGIGTLFLKNLKVIGENKRKRVQLNVMKTNTKAKDLYEKLGFTVYGENHFQFLMTSTEEIT